MHDFTYQDITQALRRVDIASDAAECQGAMSAVICFAGKDAFPLWLGAHLPEIEAGVMAGDALASETAKVSDHLYQGILQQLQAGELQYNLLLPEDDASLEMRSQAMVHWCQGFLLGLGYVGVTDTSRFQGELAEIINDITEISQMSIGDLDNSEEEEQSYAELVEYLRVGVMLLWETLSARQTQSPPTRLH